MIERKILVLRGLPASGKTTYARKWISEDSEQRIRFNRDDIRNMLGEYKVPSKEDLITSIYYHFLDEAMISGYDIVLDNMNLNKTSLSELETFVKNTNYDFDRTPIGIHYTIEYKDFFNVPIETCIERDKAREKPIGENVIRSIYNKYKNDIAPWKYLN
jgi:predicted kinase